MKSRHLYILAAVLFLVGVGGFAYKAFVTGLPVLPEQIAKVWNVELQITFEGTNKPAKVILFAARGTRRFTIVDQSFIAGGYGMLIAEEDGNKQVTLSTRKASGKQAVFYKFTVHGAEASQKRSAAPRPKITRPDWTGAKLAAAQGILKDAQRKSADPLTLAADILQRFNAQPLSDNAKVMLGKETKRNSVKAEAAAGILRLAGVGARSVHGVRLVEQQRKAATVHWLEVHDGNGWRGLLPDKISPNIPDNYFPWWRGPDRLVKVEGGQRRKVQIGVSAGAEKALFTALRAGMVQEEGVSFKFSLQDLPLGTQQVYRILLTIPLGVLLLVLLRNVIGVKTFGTFMPVLIAMAFRETQLLWGIVLFSTVVAIALSIRVYMERLKLLLVPRLAALVIVIVLAMMSISIISHQLGLARGLSVSLFPMVILTMTVERMSVVWDERGAGESLAQGIGSLAVAALAFVVMSNPYGEHLFFTFPELLLVVLAAVLLLGRYSGYRLLELPRFKAIIDRQRKAS